MVDRAGEIVKRQQISLWIAILASLIYFGAVHAQTPTPTPLPLNYQLLACYDFEEVSGTRYDQVGSNDLTDNNTVGYGSGIIGNAASFALENAEYLSAASNDFPSRDLPRTVLSWFKPKPNNYMVFSMYGEAAECRESAYGYDYVGHNITFDGSGECFIEDRLPFVTPEAWNFTGYTYDGSELILYLNESQSHISITLNTAGGFPYYVGIESAGMIDQQAVWSRALPENSVSDYYNNGSGLRCTDLPPTMTPTMTPMPGGYLQVTLSSGDSMTIKRETSYGDMGIIIILGVVVLAIVLLGILLATQIWFKQ